MEQEKEHYVYALFDNATKEIFYVGKGQGYRMTEHEKDADSYDGTDNVKLTKIQQLKSNNTYIARILGRFETEEQAFAVESMLITWVYGLDNLANVQNGHGHEDIRPYSNYEEINGIDIPKEKRDNEYSDHERDRRNRYDIVNFMESVKKEFESRLNIKFSEVITDEARFTRIYYEIGDFIIYVFSGHTSTKSIGTEVWHKANDKNVIEKLCENSDLYPLNSAKYAKVRSQRLKDINIVLSDFEQIMNIVEQYLNK